MKRRILALILMTFSLFIFSNVNAQDINNFYAEAKQNVKMADKVIGDSALAGALVNVDGEIEGIGFVAGQTVNLNGDLDYGFIAGQTIKVIGNVNKNIYIAGNTIDFTEDAKIGRDATIMGESINLSGRFGRNVFAAGTKIIISDKTVIENDITLNADEIEIAGNVAIDGTLKYNKDAKISINDSAAIKNIEETKEIKNEKNYSVNVKNTIVSIINLIVAILIFALLLPKAINKTDDVYANKDFNDYAKKFAIGMLFIICVPVASIILLASHIGTSIGLIFIALYIIALYLAYGLAGYVFGQLIFNRVLKLNINKYLIIIIGITLMKLIVLIPVVGGIVALISASIGMATIWDLVRDTNENQKPEIKGTNKVNSIKARTKLSEKPAKKSSDKNTTAKKRSNNKSTTTKKKTTTKKTETKK